MCLISLQPRTSSPRPQVQRPTSAALLSLRLRRWSFSQNSCLQLIRASRQRQRQHLMDHPPRLTLRALLPPAAPYASTRPVRSLRCEPGQQRLERSGLSRPPPAAHRPAPSPAVAQPAAPAHRPRVPGAVQPYNAAHGQFRSANAQPAAPAQCSLPHLVNIKAVTPTCSIASRTGTSRVSR